MAPETFTSHRATASPEEALVGRHETQVKVRAVNKRHSCSACGLANGAAFHHAYFEATQQSGITPTYCLDTTGWRPAKNKPGRGAI